MLKFNTRAEWLSARKAGIGASDVAAILGVSPWKGSLQLYHEKKGTVDMGSGETFARKLGLKLEDPIAELYAEKTGRTVERPPAGTFAIDVHPTRPYMMATLDGVQVATNPRIDDFADKGRGVLEIKTAVIGKAASWTNEAPIEYQVQVQHQLACTGMAWGTAVALVGGVSLFYTDIKRDEEFIGLLEGAVDEWWRRFELNEEPPADGTEATKEFLKKLYPREEPTSATLPPEAIEWDQERERAAADEKKAHERKLAAENKLKAIIGDNTQGILPNGILYTWKSVNRKGYSVEPVTFRDFRRKGAKVDLNQKIAKGAAPKIDEVLRRYYDDQEDRSAGDFDVSFE